MKYKKLLLASLLVAAGIFLKGATASAAVKTWDGSAGDNNFATAANWSGDSVPVNGDSLVLPVSAGGTYNEPITMNSNYSLSGITYSGDSGSGSCSSPKGYRFVGSGTLTLTGDISDTTTGTCDNNLEFEVNVSLGSSISLDSTSEYGGMSFGRYDSVRTLALGSNSITSETDLYILSNITGSGAITSKGLSLSRDNSGHSGNITVSDGFFSMNSTKEGSGDITVGNNATLWIHPNQDNLSFGNKITLQGTPNAGNPKIMVESGQAGCEGPFTITLTGVVTLGANATLGGDCGDTLKITNPNFGNYKLTLASAQNVKLMVGNKLTSPKYQVTTITDSKPSEGLNIFGLRKYIVNGVRGEINVSNGGILAGNGKVGNVSVGDDGILAPGLSPGCLTSANLTISAGTYQAEIGGKEACKGYDQMKVTGTVKLENDALLEVSLFDDFKPAVKDSYTIIANDGKDKVSGTFKNLKEGATFKVDGNVLKISYVGGDGNDVVLSVVSVAGAPDTGLKFVMSNPGVTLAGTAVAAGALVLMSRRLKLATKKVRR